MALATIGGEFILVVYDDPETAESIRGLLTIAHFESKIATSKVDAENKLTDMSAWEKCRGCVIDIGLPEGTSAGWELGKWIREREAKMGIEPKNRKRIVGITVYEERVPYLEREGIFDVGLQVPYSPPKLVEAFEGYVRRINE